jgi:uncharacterized protein YkwD
VRFGRAIGLGVVASLVAALALTLVGTSAASRKTQQSSAEDQLEAAILDAIDDLRDAKGAGPLVRTAALDQAASEHTSSMAENGFFSHTSLDGTGAIERIRSYFRGPGQNWTVGEVLMWAPGTVSASVVVDRWLASSFHRRALVADWQRIGIAAVYAQNAPGVYGNRDVTIVTVDFARRS